MGKYGSIPVTRNCTADQELGLSRPDPSPTHIYRLKKRRLPYESHADLEAILIAPYPPRVLPAPLERSSFAAEQAFRQRTPIAAPREGGAGLNSP